MKNLLPKVLFQFILICFWFDSGGQTKQLNDVVKIWDGGQHNAFTDLILYKNQFYCTFREGSGHIPGTDGTVRIIKSKDGKKWEDAGSLVQEGIDLRDPKLSITPDGRLMIIIGGSKYKDGKLLGRTPYVSFGDGVKFSEPQKINIDPSIVSWGDWIWRVTWNKGVGYAIDYQIGPDERRGPTAMYLVKTTDGVNFTKVSKLDIDGFPNEATIRFNESGDIIVLVRREIKDAMGVIATSKFPYTDWNFQKTNYRLGGPNFLIYKNQILATSRIYGASHYTGVLFGGLDGNFKEILSFPSSGDNSYAGMVINKGKLWISYYSSHEGKTSIYFSSIPLKNLDKLTK